MGEHWPVKVTTPPFLPSEISVTMLEDRSILVWLTAIALPVFTFSASQTIVSSDH
jgi:hypothetical protein